MTADLRDWWAADTASGRIYRDLRPQGSPLPAVTIETVSGAIDTLMKGEDALRSSRLQVNCLAVSRGEADAVAEHVIARRPFRQTAGSTNFRRLIVDQIETDNDTAPDGELTFRTRIDFIVWHRPTQQED